MPTVNSPQTSASSEQLLVVDDDLVQRTIISRIGTRLGYQPSVAPTLEQAYAMLQTTKFDLMTLDLSLGERDGVELLRMIADLNLKSMPIVVISGFDERILNTTMRVGQTLGLSLKACLQKPLNLESLREALSLAPSSEGIARRIDPPAPAIDRERLIQALARQEFFLAFQPKVSLDDGAVVGAEALVRWRMPEYGLCPPDKFIPLIEQFDLMPEFTDFVLRTAISDSRDFIAQCPGFTVAVNVSGSLLSDLNLPDRIEELLRQYDVPPASFLVEVTESVAMSDVNRAMDILVRLRIKGIGTAIDDFGTGYSSLAALARLPFSELKIDQSFAKSCTADRDMMKIVEGSVALAKAFGMKVVAEGIENEETLAKLRDCGCDIGQGYHFAPALERTRFIRWMCDRGQYLRPAIPARAAIR